MRASAANKDLLQRKRELRLRIGRSRRRIDGRLRAASDRAGELASWRTYAIRYPGWALVVALGAGLFASGGLPRRRASRWIGRSLVRHAIGRLRRRLWKELKQIWNMANERSQ